MRHGLCGVRSEQLHTAAACGDLGSLYSFFANGAEIDNRDTDAKPLLYTAVAHQQWVTVAFLLDRCADPFYFQALPPTFFHQAVLTLKNPSILPILLSLLTRLTPKVQYKVLHAVYQDGRTLFDQITDIAVLPTWTRAQKSQLLATLRSTSADLIWEDGPVAIKKAFLTWQQEFDTLRLGLYADTKNEEGQSQHRRQLQRDGYGRLMQALSPQHAAAIISVLLAQSESFLSEANSLEAMHYAAAAFAYSAKQVRHTAIHHVALQHIQRILVRAEPDTVSFAQSSFHLPTYSHLLKAHRASLKVPAFPVADTAVVFDILKANTFFFKELTAHLFREALALCSKSPPCDYALLGLGSMARDETCPHSDLECALLLGNDLPEAYAFFTRATRLFRLLIIALGETPFSVLLRTGALHLTIKGFQLDTAYNPLVTGMMGSFNILLAVQKDPAADLLKQTALQHVVVLSSSNLSLGENYYQQLRKHWNATYPSKNFWKTTQRRVQSLKSMRNLVSESPSKQNLRKPSSPIQLKKELCTFPIQWISHLCLFYELDVTGTEAALKALHQNKKINDSALRHLQNLVGGALHLRMLAHLHYGEECDEIYPATQYAAYLPKQFFILSSVENLHVLYCILLSIETLAEQWVIREGKFSLFNASFYASSNWLQIQAAERHGGGIEALNTLYETLLHESPNDPLTRVQWLTFYHNQHRAAYHERQFLEQQSKVIQDEDMLVTLNNHLSQLRTKEKTTKTALNDKILSLLRAWKQLNFPHESYFEEYVALSTELRKHYRLQLLHYRSLAELRTKEEQDFFEKLSLRLNRWPDEDGQREEWEAHKARWAETLQAMVVLPSVQPASAGLKNPTLISPLLSRKNLGAKKEVSLQGFCLQAAIVNTILTPAGTFREHKIKSSQSDIMQVTVTSASFMKEVFIKKEPELSGMTYLIELLHHQILAHGTSLSELVRLDVPKQPLLPLLVSEKVGGENFDDVLLHHPEDLVKLSHYHLSGLILMAMLTNPGDGKPANCIFSPLSNGAFTLVSVDHDHALFPAYLEENGKQVLQVRSILFCLDLMNQAVHPDVVKEFCDELDFFKVLRSVLQQAQVQDDYYKSMFDNKTVESLHDQGKGTIPIPIKKGDMLTLYQKMCRLQQYLRRFPGATLLQCLLYIEPRVGRVYQKALQTPASPRKRLEEIGDYPIDNQGNMMTSRSALISRRVVGSAIAKTDYLALETFSPAEGLAELEQLAYTQSLLAEVQAEVQQGKFYRFGILCHMDQETVLCGDSFEEAKVSTQGLLPLEWGKLSRDQQGELLQCMLKTPFHRLNLSHCQALTPAIFAQLIKASPDLCELYLDGIEDESIKQLPEGLRLHGCTTLQILHLRGATQLIELTGLQASALETLVVENSPNLRRIEINAPSLQILRAGNCPQLSAIQTNSQSLEKMDLSGALVSENGLRSAVLNWYHLKSVVLSGCRHLSVWQRLSDYPFLLSLIGQQVPENLLMALKLALDEQLGCEQVKELTVQAREKLIRSFLLFAYLPTFAEKAFRALKPFLGDSNKDTRQQAYSIVNSILNARPNIAQAILTHLVVIITSQAPEEARRDACVVACKLVRVRLELAQDALDFIRPLLIDDNELIRQLACGTVSEIVRGNSERIHYVLSYLVPLLENDSASIRCNACMAMARIMDVNIHYSLYSLQVILRKVMLLLKEPRQVALIACSVVGIILCVRPDLVELVIRDAQGLLAKKDVIERRKVFLTVRDLASMEPNLITRVLEQLSPLLVSHRPLIVKKAFLTMGNIVEVRPDLAETILKKWKPLLEHKDYDVRNEANSAITKLMSARAELAEQVSQGLERYLKNTRLNVRQNVQEGVGLVAWQIIKRPIIGVVDCLWGWERSSSDSDMDRMLDNQTELAKNLLFKPLLQDINLRANVCMVIGVAKAVFDEKDDFLIQLQSFMEDESKEVRQEAFAAVIRIVSKRPMYAKKALKHLKALLKNKYEYIRRDACLAVENTVLAEPGLAEQALNYFSPLLKDDYTDVRKHAYEAVCGIASLRIDLVECVLHYLKPLLEKGNLFCIQRDGCLVIDKIINIKPDLNWHILEEVLQQVMPLLVSPKVASAAAKLVLTIVTIRPELVRVRSDLTENLMTLLINLLDNAQEYVSSAISMLVEINPDLAQGVLERLILLLEDKMVRVAQENICMTISMVLCKAPNQLEVVLKHFVLLLSNLEVDWSALGKVTLLMEKIGEQPELALAVLNILATPWGDKYFRRYTNLLLHNTAKVMPELTLARNNYPVASMSTTLAEKVDNLLAHLGLQHQNVIKNVRPTKSLFEPKWEWEYKPCDDQLHLSKYMLLSQPEIIARLLKDGSSVIRAEAFSMINGMVQDGLLSNFDAFLLLKPSTENPVQEIQLAAIQACMALWSPLSVCPTLDLGIYLHHSLEKIKEPVQPSPIHVEMIEAELLTKFSLFKAQGTSLDKQNNTALQIVKTISAYLH